MFYSVIIAVYNRPDELNELLKSIINQSFKNFEILIIDDGSKPALESTIEEFKGNLNLKYFYKENNGPAAARNFGMNKATGNYFIFLDSDTILPKNYFREVNNSLTNSYTDFFGGSDTDSQDFKPWQKAVNYSMTSLLTTGGIRGSKKSVSKFQPRSFNMGISRIAYEKSGGFGELRFGEDPDLSIKLWELGFESKFIEGARVIHKRRTSPRSFFKQVKNFGIARPILNQRHPKYVKSSFWFPSLFIVGLAAAIVLCFFGFYIGIFFYALYFAAILFHSSIKNKSLTVGFLSVFSTLIQFGGYGSGFLLSYLKIRVLQIPSRKAFPNHFRK